MKYFYSIILTTCLIAACSKDPYDNLANDTRLTAMNTGLIAVNNDFLFLNKVNDITLYDFGGTQIRILNTYPRQQYRELSVTDSFIYLKGSKGVVYSFRPPNILTEVKPEISLQMQVLPSDLFIKDSIHYILSRNTEYFGQYGTLMPAVYSGTSSSYKALSGAGRGFDDAGSMMFAQDTVLVAASKNLNLLNPLTMKRMAYQSGVFENTRTYCINIGNYQYFSSGAKLYSTQLNGFAITPIKEIK